MNCRADLFWQEPAEPPSLPKQRLRARPGGAGSLTWGTQAACGVEVVAQQLEAALTVHGTGEQGGWNLPLVPRLGLQDPSPFPDQGHFRDPSPSIGEAGPSEEGHSHTCRPLSKPIPGNRGHQTGSCASGKKSPPLGLSHTGSEWIDPQDL